MLKPEMISEFTRQIGEKFSGAGLPGEAELKRQMQSVAENVFAKLNLVTREEFDIQTDVLLRTRAKADALEVQVAQLEASLATLMAKESNVTKEKE
ncbi:accessory factor UbiK family protein [Oceanospirillum maris]|jgi:BMFP domain-containing protein YqiC|uniref:accessory factor UbiK family protein n=1 Tax=Oceanospirillum maris TaxID=64977 RepID=UPI000405D810|nr:accessory factor UbiK family protein [Oceanospirillum maris]